MINLGIVAAIAYGLLTVLGGVMAYIRVKSTASLLSGVISGLLLLLAGVFALQGQSWGLMAAAVLTLVLIVVFIVRWTKTKKLMPAGLMVGSGVPVLALILFNLS